MSEDEVKNEAEQLEEFKENFREGLITSLEFAAEFTPDAPIPPDPLSMGFDERTLEEISRNELAVVQEVLYQELGLEPAIENFKVREYVASPSEGATVPGEVEVYVYKTNREGIFLQELLFKDGQKRWMFGPDVNIDEV